MSKKGKKIKKGKVKYEATPEDAAYLEDLTGTCYWLSGKLRSMVSLDMPSEEIDRLNGLADLALDSAAEEPWAPSQREVFERFHRLLPPTDTPAMYALNRNGYAQMTLGGEVVDAFPLHPYWLARLNERSA